jgi:hypothetical protein
MDSPRSVLIPPHAASNSSPTPAPTPAIAPTAARVTVPPPSVVRRPWGARLRDHVAAYFHARDVGPSALAVFALVLSVTAAGVLLSGHLGFGSSLALVALVCGGLSVAPPPWEMRGWDRLSVGLLPLADLLVVGGLFGGLVGRYPPLVCGLGLLVFVLTAWLPLSKATAGPEFIPPEAGLWRRSERLAVLLLGTLVARPGAALLLVALVGCLDAALRVERLARAAGVLGPERPAPWRGLVAADGTLEPRVRLVSLAVTALLVVLLPTSDRWYF